jgi:arylsulfatase A-like enzyme
MGGQEGSDRHVSDKPAIIYTSFSIPPKPAPEPTELPDPYYVHESRLIRGEVEHAVMHGIPQVHLPRRAVDAITAMELHLEAWQAGLRGTGRP